MRRKRRVTVRRTKDGAPAFRSGALKEMGEIVDFSRAKR